MKHIAIPVVLGVLVSAPVSASGQDLAAAITDLANSAVDLPSACPETDPKCIKREQKADAKWEMVRDTAGSDELKALSQTGALVKKLEKGGDLGPLALGAENLALLARQDYANRIIDMRTLLGLYTTPEGNPLERFAKSIDKVEGKGAQAEERFLSRGNEQYGNFMKKSVGVIKSAEKLSGKIHQFIAKQGLILPTDLALVGPPCDTWSVECIGDVCTTEVMISVANNGPNNAGAFVIRVTFDPDAVSVDVRVPGLQSGETRDFVIESPPGGNCLDPVCSIRIEIDAEGAISETDEENNSSVWDCIAD